MLAKEAEEAGDVKLLAVSQQDGGECVTPSPETIAAEFPIGLLYTYVNAEAAAADPAVAAFVDYMMSDEGLKAVSNAGYIDLAPADQTLAKRSGRTGQPGAAGAEPNQNLIPKRPRRPAGASLRSGSVIGRMSGDQSSRSTLPPSS